MADFQEDSGRRITPIRFDSLFPAGTVLDIKKDGVSIPGFPKTVPTGKELEATLKITGELRDE